MSNFENIVPYNAYNETIARRSRHRRLYNESHSTRKGQRDRYLERWATHHNSYPGRGSLEMMDFYPNQELETRDMGNKLFAISHREVFDLFSDWGWEEGPERGDGHKRMTKEVAGIPRTVQIMPPDRPGTGEKGNAIAIKTAARLMEMTIHQFLDGPQDDETRQRRMERHDRVVKLAEERAHRQRVAHEAATQQQEDQMSEDMTGRGHSTGVSVRIVETMSKRAGQRRNLEEWVRFYRQDHPDDDQTNDTSITSLISQMSKRSKYPFLERTDRGVYRWRSERPTVPTPPAVDPSPVDMPSDPVDTEHPVSLNGSSPDLLSKVHVLDGGRYLFQGDDGALYVVSSLVRLNV